MRRRDYRSACWVCGCLLDQHTRRQLRACENTRLPISFASK